MTGTLRIRRSRGAVSGVLLVLLGLWGALIPFIGPYFNYAFTPDNGWQLTAGRVWLELLPGLATIASGVVIVISRLRLVAVAGACVAAVAGAWFATGGLVSHAWPRLPGIGKGVGGAGRGLLEQLGFFTGLGLAIVFLAALVVGRFTVTAARDVVVADDLGGQAEPSGPRIARWLRLPSPVVRGGRPGRDETAEEVARTEAAGWNAG
jgi:hypothetical protein